MVPLTLASQSPQRISLLARLGLEVEVRPSGVDETAIAVPADPAAQVQALARAKATAVASQRPRHLVLGADTLVALDGLVMGKPGSPQAATQMLRRLSGRRHAVHTGIALIVPTTGTEAPPAWASGDATRRRVRALLPSLRMSRSAGHSVLTAVVSASVDFHQIDEEQIAAYVRTGEPLDKAGGYGIQGDGSRMVAALRGCFTTVVGLPVCAVTLLLSAVSGQRVACPADPACRMDGRTRCLCEENPPAGRPGP